MTTTFLSRKFAAASGRGQCTPYHVTLYDRTHSCFAPVVAYVHTSLSSMSHRHRRTIVCMAVAVLSTDRNMCSRPNRSPREETKANDDDEEWLPDKTPSVPRKKRGRPPNRSTGVSVQQPQSAQDLAPERDLSDEGLSDVDSDEEERPAADQGELDTEALHWTAYTHEGYEPEVLCDQELGTQHLPVNMRDRTPLDFVLLLLPLKFFDRMAKETNRYAHQVHSGLNPGEPSRSRGWANVTRSDIVTWLGCVLHMALFPLPAVSYYFRDVGSRYISVPNLSTVMSQLRFEQIKRFLHLNDNHRAKPVGHPNHDRMHKVRPLISLVQQTFQYYYRLGPHVSVDESIIPDKSRTYWKQYCKDKPHKWGIKLWCMCCAGTGYFYAVVPYAGKGSVERVHGLATDSVTALVRIAGIQNTNRVIYTDRWFTSPQLLWQLGLMGLLGCGTVMRNRKGVPKDFNLPRASREHPVPRGTSRCAQAVVNNTRFYFSNWLDTKDVSFLSSVYGCSPVTVTRRLKNGAEHEVPIPINGKQYQNYMGGVDMGDQAKLAYSIETQYKSHKPWHKLFVGIVDMVLANAWCLYRLTVPENGEVVRYNHYEFLVQVADGLIELGRDRERNQVISTTRGPGKHRAEKVPAKLCCVHCKHNGVRRRVITRCEDCLVHLCLGNCFRDYHDSNYPVHKRHGKSGTLKGKRRRNQRQ